jgi:hypothetical protein
MDTRGGSHRKPHNAINSHNDLAIALKVGTDIAKRTDASGDHFGRDIDLGFGRASAVRVIGRCGAETTCDHCDVNDIIGM